MKKTFLDYDPVDHFYSRKADERIVLRDKDEQAAFYSMERLAEQYSYRFFDILSSRDFIGDYTLPLVFKTKSEAILETGLQSISPPRFGYSKHYPKLSAITIFLPERRKRVYLHRSLKQYIRHELIHYYLYIKDLPFEDDSFLFWAYCYIYDGGAYAPLNEERQLLYDEFIDTVNRSGIERLSSLQDLAEEMSASFISRES